MTRRNSPIPVRFCVDRVVPFSTKVSSAAKAVAENPKNAPDHVTVKKLPGVSVHPLKMALETGKRWKPGRLLKVRFLNGSPTQKDKVRTHAATWLEHANIRFDWVTSGSAEIRVAFGADSGSWSAVGTDALLADYFPKSEPTMNFGWVEDDSDETEDRAVVLHEFGHALGAIHEHQSPNGGIVWNEQAVIDYFAQPPNEWSEEETRHNVIEKYSLSQLNSTTFDRKSIMLYSFPGALIRSPASLKYTGTTENSVLSTRDKKFIRKMYPFP